MPDLGFFRQNGYVSLGQVFDGEELSRFIELYDRDRSKMGCFWHPIANHGHQTLNCEPLISSPEIDGLIRHPSLIEPIETIFEGPSCLGEVCLRHMVPRDGNPEEIWHRDRPHATDRPGPSSCSTCPCFTPRPYGSPRTNARRFRYTTAIAMVPC